MVMARLDQKMRIRLPKSISKKLRLRGRETLDISEKNGEIRIIKPKKISTENDPILRDMIERPMHSKIKITSELLEKWEDEQWSS